MKRSVLFILLVLATTQVVPQEGREILILPEKTVEKRVGELEHRILRQERQMALLLQKLVEAKTQLIAAGVENDRIKDDFEALTRQHMITRAGIELIWTTLDELRDLIFVFLKQEYDKPPKEPDLGGPNPKLKA